MSKIDELIQRLCPNGVEWKKIGDICNTITDYTAAGSFANIAENVKYISEKEYAQLVRTTDLKSNFSNPDKFVYVNEHAFNYLWRVNLIGEGLILPNVGNCGEIYHYTENSFPCKNNVLGPNAILVKSDKANMRFLFHLFQSIEFQSDLAKITSQTGQTKFNKTNFKNLEIPLPPLPVQEEIVRILDAFTSHAAELQAELQARREQYEYYRNKLLSFEDDSSVEWKTIKDICDKICSGGTPSTSNKNYYSGNIPWLRTQEVDWQDVYDTSLKISEEAISNSSAKIIPANCVIIAMYGATAAKSCINRIPLATNQACCNLQINKEIADYKYVYHFVCKEYENLKSLGEGSQSNLNAKKIKDYEIPIPPLSEQRRIVAILDKLEALVNDLTEGLPAEIAARQEQYEYYRDMLLSFPKAV